VRVRCPDSGPLRRALTARGEVRRTAQDELEVTGLAAATAIAVVIPARTTLAGWAVASLRAGADG
jgi:hypothetical protein